jgi:hypothetical protein
MLDHLLLTSARPGTAAALLAAAAATGWDSSGDDSDDSGAASPRSMLAPGRSRMKLPDPNDCPPPRRLNVWRAHNHPITAMEWLPVTAGPPGAAAAAAGAGASVGAWRPGSASVKPEASGLTSNKDSCTTLGKSMPSVTSMTGLTPRGVGRPCVAEEGSRCDAGNQAQQAEEGEGDSCDVEPTPRSSRRPVSGAQSSRLGPKVAAAPSQRQVAFAAGTAAASGGGAAGNPFSRQASLSSRKSLALDLDLSTEDGLDEAGAAATAAAAAAAEAAAKDAAAAVEDGMACLLAPMAEGYIVTGAFDASLCLWSRQGALIGSFGRDGWQLADRSTWAATSAAALVVRRWGAAGAAGAGKRVGR